MAAAEPLLLNQLCSVCSNNRPKYTCPRCQSRTCSLSCCRRHKLWAQCSGKRDPASFIKRSQLATPAGLDHDFNYLTGVERFLDTSAERHPQDESTPRNGHTASLRKRFEQFGIRVQNAPKGMSRQKQNRTRWHDKLKCIRWTVEWIHQDGSRELSFCRDNASLLSNYKQTSKQQPHKRRKLCEHENTPSVNESIPYDAGVDTTKSGPSEQDKSAMSRRGTLSNWSEEEVLVDDSLTVSEGDRSAKGVPDKHERPIAPTEAEQDSMEHQRDEPDISNNASRGNPKHFHPREPSNLYFYLVKPNTGSSTKPVLIPINPTKTLSVNLSGQVVLEFPTIQVSEHGPSDLPETLQLEKDYLKQMRRRIQEIDDELGDCKVPAPVLSSLHMPDTLDDQGRVANESVMESLRKDLYAVSGKSQAA